MSNPVSAASAVAVTLIVDAEQTLVLETGGGGGFTPSPVGVWDMTGSTEVAPAPIPAGARDFDQFLVTGAGWFAGKQTRVGDYVEFYADTANIIIWRLPPDTLSATQLQEVDQEITTAINNLKAETNPFPQYSNAVRFDEGQDLNAGQRGQARTNIEAEKSGTADQLISERAVRFDAGQTLTAPQQAQARTNIGAVSAAGAAAAAPVQSVNGKTGAAVLTAVDVGADESGAAAAAQAFAIQRSNQTGTQPATTISDFSPAVTAVPAVAGAVRFDTAQTLTSPQQTQARSNIGIARGTGHTTTPLLSPQAIASGVISLARAFTLLTIQTNYAARVRLYDTIAHRNADLNRGIGIYPADDSGCLFEFITSATLLSATIGRPVNGFNNETVVSDSIAYSITNLDPSSRVIDVTLGFLPTE